MKVNLSPDNDLVLTPAFYSSIVKYGSDLITVLSPEGLYLYVSDSIQSILGYEPDDLLGTNVTDLLHPEDIPIVSEHFYDLVYGKEAQLALQPFRFRAKNGKWHWLSCVATNMLDNPNVQGIVTNSRDITSNMEALEQKKISQAYYKALYFNNPDLVFTLNAEGRVEACNDAVFTITGYERDLTAEPDFIDYILPEYRQEAWEAFSKAVAGQPYTFDTCIRHMEGDIRHLTVTLVPVAVEGRVRAVQCIAKDATSEKKANRLVKDQARRLHNTLESITEAFFSLDNKWCYSFGNSVFANFMNREINDLLHCCIWEEYPWLVGSEFHKRCYHAVATGKSQKFEEYFSNYELTLRFSVNPFEDGLSISFADITEQVAAQDELRKLSLVASKTTNGVIITDKDGLIEWVNESLSAVSGYSLDEIIGKRPGDILTGPGIDQRELAFIRDQLSKGIPIRKEFLGFKKSGETIWADLSISPVRNDRGEVIKHVYVHTDITERKLDQEQLLRATEDLYLQNQDLQQFNYIVSHNLRAPVANLVGLSSMLQKMERSGNRFEVGLQNLEKSARRLDDVITDLNKILAARSAHTNEAREQVCVATVAAEVLQSLQDLLESAGGQIALDISEDTMLWANRAYVYSIIHNLVSNAIKYKSAERSLLINISSVRNEKGMVLHIKDNGSGMDLSIVGSRLFQLYKRFHSGFDGKGIGLYLVKMQVEAIGGRVTVESEVEKGTTFTLHFEEVANGQ